MRHHAEGFTGGLVTRSRLPLDYSVASLRVVDSVVEGLRQGNPAPSQVSDLLLGFGAYLGEVLVRHAGAVWVDFDERERDLFGHSVGVRMPDGRVWNPLGRVAKRFALGRDQSLHTFYLTLHGRRAHASAA
ncbi:hypothetical protein [Streptomyces sp. TR06-5]|uniref:hypothetical protein n=1 Tax=unclassified Streptomyces TaxID=2593676 RepID=UPI0039A3F669